MPRLRSTVNGLWVTVPDDHPYTQNAEFTDQEAGPYGDLKVAELKDEINRRNATREEKLPVGGNRTELIARLEADDAAAQSDNDTDQE